MHAGIVPVRAPPKEDLAHAPRASRLAHTVAGIPWIGLYQTAGGGSAMGETLPIRTAWATEHWTADSLRKFLAGIAPLGQSYVYHALNVYMMNHRDFEAACDHFGMRRLLVDVALGDVFGEMRARKARAEPPSAGTLPLFLDSLSREEADARIALYNRRVAEAEARFAAQAPARASPEPAAP